MGIQYPLIFAMYTHIFPVTETKTEDASKSFLEDKSKVTGISDVLSRMGASSAGKNVVKDETV